MNKQELYKMLNDHNNGIYKLEPTTINIIIEELLIKLGYDIWHIEKFVEFKYDGELVFYIHKPSNKLYIEDTMHPLGSEELKLIAQLMEAL